MQVTWKQKSILLKKKFHIGEKILKYKKNKQTLKVFLSTPGKNGESWGSMRKLFELNK